MNNIAEIIALLNNALILLRDTTWNSNLHKQVSDQTLAGLARLIDFFQKEQEKIRTNDKNQVLDKNIAE